MEEIPFPFSAQIHRIVQCYWIGYRLRSLNPAMQTCQGEDVEEIYCAYLHYLLLLGFRAHKFPLSPSMSQSYLPLALAALGVMLTSTYLRRRNKPTDLPLPPSPKPDFLIGHLRSLPSSNEHKVYQQWSKELGSKSCLEATACSVA